MEFSASYEAYQNKKEFQEKKSRQEEAYEVFLNLKKDAQNSYTIISQKYADIFEQESIDIGERLDFNEEIEKQIKDPHDHKLWRIYVEYMKGGRSLESDIENYVLSIKKYEAISHTLNKKDSNEKDHLQSLTQVDAERTTFHNRLINKLQQLSIAMRNAGFDISGINKIGLNARYNVQVWAEYIETALHDESQKSNQKKVA